MAAKSVCWLWIWVWVSDLIPWLGQEGWPCGYKSLKCKNHEELLSGLDIDPVCISMCSLFSSLCYWFQLDKSHHIMFLPTSISLIEMLLTLYSVYNGFFTLRIKIEFRAPVKLDREKLYHCCQCVAEIHHFLYQLVTNYRSFSSTYLWLCH